MPGSALNKGVFRALCRALKRRIDNKAAILAAVQAGPMACEFFGQFFSGSDPTHVHAAPIYERRSSASCWKWDIMMPWNEMTVA